MTYLFDGYLTESISYPHFMNAAYLTENCLAIPNLPKNAMFSGLSLFDGYLIEPQTGSLLTTKLRRNA